MLIVIVIITPTTASCFSLVHRSPLLSFSQSQNFPPPRKLACCRPRKQRDRRGPCRQRRARVGERWSRERESSESVPPQNGANTEIHQRTTNASSSPDKKCTQHCTHTVQLLSFPKNYYVVWERARWGRKEDTSKGGYVLPTPTGEQTQRNTNMNARTQAPHRPPPFIRRYPNTECVTKATSNYHDSDGTGGTGKGKKNKTRTAGVLLFTAAYYPLL